VAFEEAAANQEVAVSQVGSEPDGHEDAIGYDVVLRHKDAWGFL
jgi:hypothetical protein